MTKSVLFFARVPRGCDVALWATWQHHAGPRGVHIFIFILHILYSRGIQPSVDWKGIQPISSSGLINPTCFFNLFRVGLKSHRVLLIAGHVAQGEALDRRCIGNPRVHRVNAGPPINQ